VVTQGAGARAASRDARRGGRRGAGRRRDVDDLAAEVGVAPRADVQRVRADRLATAQARPQRGLEAVALAGPGRRRADVGAVLRGGAEVEPLGARLGRADAHPDPHGRGRRVGVPGPAAHVDQARARRGGRLERAARVAAREPPPRRDERDRVGRPPGARARRAVAVRGLGAARHGEVQVRPGRVARAADRADPLAPRDDLPDLELRRVAEVRVDRVPVLAARQLVAQHDHVPVAVGARPGAQDRPVRRRVHGRAERRAPVDPEVRAVVGRLAAVALRDPVLRRRLAGPEREVEAV
jgi:hypothetical protein